jgi:hypothetical protein
MQPVLVELLLRARLLDDKRLARATEVAQETSCSLAHALVKLGLVSERALAHLVSQALQLRMVDPSRLEIQATAIEALAGPIAQRLRVLPVRLRSNAEGDFIYVVMSDPTDQAAVRQVEAVTGREVMPVVAGELALERALVQHYGADDLRFLQARATQAEVVVGVLQETPSYAQVEPEDDGAYFTESTEEIMMVYSRTMNRVAKDADAADLDWLKERQQLVEGRPLRDSPQTLEDPPAIAPPDEFEDATTHKLLLEDVAIAIAASPAARAMPLPEITTGEVRATRSSLLSAAKPMPVPAVRAPLCLVAGDEQRRGTLRAHLARHAARLYAEGTLGAAHALGQRVTLGYIVVVAPEVAPGIADGLRRLKAMAGSPRVMVVGGDPAFQAVPGVDAWLDELEPPAALADEILAALKRLGAS